jgi:hypothetical protein
LAFIFNSLFPAPNNWAPQNLIEGPARLDEAGDGGLSGLGVSPQSEAGPSRCSLCRQRLFHKSYSQLFL